MLSNIFMLVTSNFQLEHLSNKIDYELLAYKIREIIESLTQLTGKNVNEQLLDGIFKDFCVGK